MVEPDGSSPIEMINAVTLLTGDMSAAVEFYGELGFALIFGGRGEPFSTFSAGSGFLNLQLDPNWRLAAIWGRVIFWVDDVDAMYSRVVAGGLVPEMAPTDAPWGERYFHLRDRDGHELSFARPVRRRR